MYNRLCCELKHHKYFLEVLGAFFFFFAFLYWQVGFENVLKCMKIRQMKWCSFNKNNSFWTKLQTKRIFLANLYLGYCFIL